MPPGEILTEAIIFVAQKCAWGAMPAKADVVSRLNILCYLPAGRSI